jgi:hypothetical protein
MTSFISDAPQVSERPPTDLAQLWQKAFIDYNAAVGEKAKKTGCQLNVKGLSLAPNLDSVRSSVDETSKAFNKWRQDGGSLDKVLSIIGDNLGYAQAIGDQIIDSATAAFPLAGAIWIVATYAIKACQSMSRDYNQLVALIGETGNFLKTLQIIEEKVPGCKIYKECVTDALTALMIVFVIQSRFMYEGRALQFWHQLKGGDDDGPDKAYANVTAAIDRRKRLNGCEKHGRHQEPSHALGRQTCLFVSRHDASVSAARPVDYRWIPRAGQFDRRRFRTARQPCRRWIRTRRSFNPGRIPTAKDVFCSKHAATKRDPTKSVGPADKTGLDNADKIRCKGPSCTQLHCAEQGKAILWAHS